MMQSIILAAGMGKRLKELTKDNTKCMVKVNGITLIERMLRKLIKHNVTRVVIVDGYQADKLEKFVYSLNLDIPIIFIRNEEYASTNNIYSLALAKEWLCREDTLLLESDLIFEESIIEMLLEDEYDTVALVDKYENWMDGTCVKIDGSGNIKEFIPGNKFRYEDVDYYYKTVNIYKFSSDFSEKCYVPFLEAYAKALGNNEYYEQVLRVITLLDEPHIKAKKLEGQLWYEIDDIQDLDIAESIFADDEVKTDLIQNRFGGYWRYPKIHDFCYSGNPFYPPKRMTDELMANLGRIITSYPSGNRVNSLLVAKDMGVDINHVVVSNGLEELIKTIFSISDAEQRIGIIKPINEEYVRRFRNHKCIAYDLADKGMCMDAEDIIRFFSGTEADMLIISNPNTHIGSYMQIDVMRRLLDWAQGCRILTIVDESYIDFASERGGSLIESGAYRNYKNLVVFRNLSASQGLFGLRIGCAISSNRELCEKFSDEMTIWNVNSVAEFYLQIMEKYRKDYKASLLSVNKARNRLIADINSIEGLEALPSETNYVACRITKPEISARSLTKRLLTHHNILVKDLTGRISDRGQYIRVAINNPEKNNEIVNALKTIFAEGRIKGAICEINEGDTRDFFDERADKPLPHRYNYVIYQDGNPELALQRDTYEKKKMLPYIIYTDNMDVLDIGCGVGRWADELNKHSEIASYTGVDYSINLLNIAKSEFKNNPKVSFLHGSFQDVKNVLSYYNKKTRYSLILINGVLMYLNDRDLKHCMNQAYDLLDNDGVIYIKESVGREQRFTLADYYSKEFKQKYNAIYRGIEEYQHLMESVFNATQCTILDSGETWPQTMENRSETTSYYWIIKKGNRNA